MKLSLGNRGRSREEPQRDAPGDASPSLADRIAEGDADAIGLLHERYSAALVSYHRVAGDPAQLDAAVTASLEAVIGAVQRGERPTDEELPARVLAQARHVSARAE